MTQVSDEVRRALQNSGRLAREANSFIQQHKSKPPGSWSSKRDSLVRRLQTEIDRLKRLTPKPVVTATDEDLVNRAFALGRFKDALELLGKK